MPEELVDLGVRFHALDRADWAGIERLVGGGADLLLDTLAFSARDVRPLLPVMGIVGASVAISGRAVYVDDEGRHVNSDNPPVFLAPVREDNATLPPAADDVDPFTRDGYGPGKVAVERTLFDSGLPVTVIRPSKVHGRWARNARTRNIVQQMMRGSRVRIDKGESSVEHLTAASNTAALIEAIASVPEARVLNSADPGVVIAGKLSGAIAATLGWSGSIEFDSTDVAGVPMVLDTSAALELGYEAVGDTSVLISEEVLWLAEGRRYDS
jgi:nucleoside-diphosphate-sugar epimerase